MGIVFGIAAIVFAVGAVTIADRPREDRSAAVLAAILALAFMAASVSALP